MAFISSKYFLNDNGLFQCPHCEKTTKNQSTMYYHLKTHTKETNFECTYCKKGFVQKSAYLQHLAIHHPEEPIPSDEIKVEKNPFSEKKFHCVSCENEFRTKAQMQVHFARVHCREWIPNYSSENKNCLNCKKEFQNSTGYLYHCISCLKCPSDLVDQVKTVIS